MLVSVDADPASSSMYRGLRSLDQGSWIQDTAFEILHPGSCIQNSKNQTSRSKVLSPGFWILHPRPRILEGGTWIRDPRSWLADPGPWILDPEYSIRNPESPLPSRCHLRNSTHGQPPTPVDRRPSTPQRGSYPHQSRALHRPYPSNDVLSCNRRTLCTAYRVFQPNLCARTGTSNRNDTV